MQSETQQVDLLLLTVEHLAWKAVAGVARYLVRQHQDDLRWTTWFYALVYNLYQQAAHDEIQ